MDPVMVQDGSVNAQECFSDAEQKGKTAKRKIACQQREDIHDQFPPPPCEINLHSSHTVVKIALYLCSWGAREEAPAWPKEARATRQKNAEREGRQKKNVCTARHLLVSLS